MKKRSERKTGLERMKEIEVLDVVAILEDVPQHGLLCGEVGTVVELWKDGLFEVKFSGPSGKAYAFAALRADQLEAQLSKRLFGMSVKAAKSDWG